MSRADVVSLIVFITMFLIPFTIYEIRERRGKNKNYLPNRMDKEFD